MLKKCLCCRQLAYWLILHSGVFFPGDLIAQPSVERLRAEIHHRLKSGHSALPYGQTDEAMSTIHADPANHNNVVLFYTGRTQNAEVTVGGDSHNGWNREHLWPQSRGSRRAAAKSDLHHLVPADASVNQYRGNRDFDNGGQRQGEAPDTFIDENSLEPRDTIKGDVARALFYMDVRYEGTDGEPDLVLVNTNTVTPGANQLGNLCTLLEWHRGDPVSPSERARNSAISKIQGNRNAFIDEPELAELILSASCGSVLAQGVSDRAAPNQLRIATWNIANLHHETGVALRSNSVIRDNEDYRRLAGIAASLDADIAVLQEVGSPAAVSRVFPESQYHIVISDRYQPGAENRPATGRDIYTAIVFAKQTFEHFPVIDTLTALSIEHIGFDRDGLPGTWPTRAGVIANLSIAGRQVRLMGVHLKSFCHRWSLAPVADQSEQSGNSYASRFACRTLRAQLSILESWVEQQAALDIIPIVAGDFNRHLNAVNQEGESKDHFWLDLNDGAPDGLQLEKAPEGIDTVCWPNHTDRYEEHIDMFVYDRRLGDAVTVDSIVKHTMGFESDAKYRLRDKRRLSDHCPVVMTMSW